MVIITVQNYTKAGVHTITVENRKSFWVKMIDVQNGLGIKNISDLVRKYIQGIYETKSLNEEQFRKYKRSQKDDSKFKYARSDLMAIIIKNCRGVKQCNGGINRMEKKNKEKI